MLAIRHVDGEGEASGDEGFVLPAEHPTSFYGPLSEAATFENTRSLLTFVDEVVCEGFTVKNHEVVRVDEEGLQAVL